jgi:sugar lactone lactonase YvrE
MTATTTLAKEKRPPRMETMARQLECGVECVADVRNTVGESPVWSVREQALYWVDIPEGRIHRWEPSNGGLRTWQRPHAVGSMGLRAAGGLVLASKKGFELFDPETGAATFLHQPEPDIPNNRLNDGKVSPDGRFWAGTMDDRPVKERTGHLYRLDADHSCRRMASSLIVSNGLAWSPDGRTMYHSDSRAAAIYRYDYEMETGAIGARQLHVAMQPAWGRPDGAAVDAEGCYWSCGISAGRLNRFSPSGELLVYVVLPVTHPTMPCFGGSDLKTLYVTSLREGLPDDVLKRTPQAGSLFALTPGVAGTPVAHYRG